ncbi:MAG: neutral zinc metallopeptidase [Actinomycetota bacterium]|nr:neutral zinc metallopeptidase [Actinomycetota bacterium]
MRFNPRARVDQSQIDNRGGDGGGLGGGGRMQLPIPAGGGGKIGLGTVVIIILFVVITQCTGPGGSPSGSAGGTGQGSVNDACQTGADANSSTSCEIDLVTNSVQAYWKKALPKQTGTPYKVTKTVKFSGQTSSACGTAASQMGPFYCPNDERVYLDSTFFKDMLQGQLHAKGGPFAVAYVIAHEYGHHVEDQVGILAQMKTQQGPASDSVKAELMADCLAGSWAKNALTTTDASGQPIISDLTQDDVRRAIDAAQAVGDDRIQKQSQGRVNPESFTHGTSAQRESWFNIGRSRGTIAACNTFKAPSL